MKITLKPAHITSFLRMGISTYRGKLLIQATFLGSAVGVGLAAVYFGKLIGLLQEDFARVFNLHPYLMTLATPIFFILSTAVVRYVAPHAGGSGVPQVLFASSLSNRSNTEVVKSGLLSLRTACIKVISTALGFLGGASIGGEGPTVQISGSIFASIGQRVRERFPQIDFHSYLVASAGVGIAAAFNTPLGGLAFVIEEFALGDFGELRHTVMLAIIVAGLTVQSLIGDERYFGNPGLAGEAQVYLGWAILIGVIGGALGGIFGKIVASERLHQLPVNWWQRALGFGVVVAILGLLFHGETAGSGYISTRTLIEGVPPKLPLIFPLAKLLATACSTLSGMGGGILAPSLSIGAWMGVSVAKIASLANFKVCAMLGMAAYFAGAFQIPVTAVIVVTEMTNEHAIIFPMMIAALASYLVARVIMPVSLYHHLIKRTFSKTTLSD